MTSVTDGSRLLTPAEIYDRFSSNGQLDTAAAAAYISKNTGQSVTADTLEEHLDSDHDGTITRDEFIKNSPRPGQPGAPPMSNDQRASFLQGPVDTSEQAVSSDPADERLLRLQRSLAYNQRFV